MSSHTPQPEASPRLAQQLAQLAKGSALLDNREEVNELDLALVERVALDSMPAIRCTILDHVVRHEHIERAELAKLLGLSKSQVSYKLEEQIHERLKPQAGRAAGTKRIARHQ